MCVLACKVFHALLVCAATSADGMACAIKVAKLERGPREKKLKGITQSDGAIGLAVERRVYQVQLPGMPGVPRLPKSPYGDVLGYRYLAMQRLDASLKEKAAACGGRTRFSDEAIALVAASLVRAVPLSARISLNL